MGAEGRPYYSVQGNITDLCMPKYPRTSTGKRVVRIGSLWEDGHDLRLGWGDAEGYGCYSTTAGKPICICSGGT